jgi:Calx-beta domain-containing protein
MRTQFGSRSRALMLLTSAALLAMPVADAFGAPKARVKFASKVVIVSETAGVGELNVTRSRRLTETVTVRYATSSATAAAGASCAEGVDFQPVTGTLTFAPGDTSETIQVPICDDTAVEGGEFVDVALTRPAPGVVVSGGIAQLAIADNDGPARITFASTDTLVFENGGPARLSVIRLGDPTHSVSVDYATSDGTANAGTDYVQANGTLNFPGIGTDAAGATLQTIDVALTDDVSHESHEDMSVVLSSSGGSVVATPSTSRITIIDDDSPASIAFADATATVGEADGSLTVTLRRNGAPGEWVSASYSTVNGTALAGSDFAGTGFDANEPGADPLFAPGEMEVSFEVPITDDSASEGDEGFGLQLSDLQSESGTPGVSVRPSMNVTIADDEPAPSTEPAPTTEPVADTGTAPGAAAGAGAPSASGAPVTALDVAATCGVSVRAARRQRVARRKAIVLRLATKRACTVRMRATIKGGKARSSTVRTRLVTARLAAGKRTVVKLRLGKKDMRRITKALQAKRSVRASVQVSSVPASGKALRRTLALRLSR